MFKSAFAMLICLLLLVGLSVGAFASSVHGVKVEGIIAEKAKYLECDADMESILSALKPDAGTTFGDWFVFGLGSLYPEEDYSEYFAEAYEKLQNSASYTDHLRVGLAASVCGEELSEEFLSMIEAEALAVEDMLVSELIFTLLWGKLRGESDSERMELFREELLSRQLPDGGFALVGKYADTDVTAMALCALCDSEEDAVCAEILQVLSRVQNADGGFGSMGTPNCESVAQVIIALSSIGIDVETDPRFLKNGVSPVDALERYRAEEGCYSHLLGGNVSDMATDQAFLAYIALFRQEEGLGSIYSPSVKESPEIPPEEEPSQPSETEEPLKPIEPTETTKPQTEVVEKPADDEPAEVNVKIIVGLIGGSVLTLSVFFLIRKKSRVFFGLALISALALIFPFVEIQSVDEYYAENPEMLTEDSETVTVEIDCSTVLENYDDLDPGLKGGDYVPEDGLILPETKILLHPGDTVLSVLRRISRYMHIQTDIEDSRTGAYIRGINYLYEGSCGDLSGWMFTVNGEFSGESASEITLSEGDSIRFLYTCDLGRDVGDKWNGE